MHKKPDGIKIKKPFILWGMAVMVLFAIALQRHSRYALAGAVFYSGLLLLPVCFGPASWVHEGMRHGPVIGGKEQRDGRWLKKTAFKWLLVAALIAGITLPMGINPKWNGEKPAHRNQYEKMAESLLHGKLYLEYEDTDPDLLAMDNPYDVAKREELGIHYHYDHAWFNGHYYMYFGVVPAVILFLPWRALTGMPLTTYHATQLFACLAVIGIFVLFEMLQRAFFPEGTYAVYLTSAAAVSMISLWYAIGEPALYCTAITAGLALQIWSLVFYFKAVFLEEKSRRRTVYACLGALCGALVFGCRPPIALANLMALPLLVRYTRQRFNSNRREWIRTVVLCVCIYAVIAALLMLYNYLRFGDVLEFGQTYQLTSANQSDYGNISDRLRQVDLPEKLRKTFFGERQIRTAFPHVREGGVMLNFPALLFPVILLIPCFGKQVQKRRGVGFAVFLVLTAAAAAAADALMAPWHLERYNMDLYYLLGILMFIAMGTVCASAAGTGRRYASVILCLLNLVTFAGAWYLVLVPSGANLTVYDPQINAKVLAVLTMK